MSKIKLVIISESIRRDSHLPLQYFENIEVTHLYLEAPYGDLSKKDLEDAIQITFKDLRKNIEKINPDVIQGPEPFGSKNALRLSNQTYKAVAKNDKKLIIPVLENRPISKRFGIFQRLVLRLFCPRYFKRADLFVALNEGAKTNIKYYSQNPKIVDDVIWGIWGVDLRMFRPKGKKETGLIGYVGRLVEDKGIEYLLEGFRDASKRLPYLKLKIAGKGDLEDYIREFIKDNDLEQKIKLVGFLNNDDLIDFMSNSELVIYPSVTMPRWEEQVGTVNFQAMACGTPVLTTNSGAIPEYIEDGQGAIVVEERSSKAIADAIVKYFSNRSFADKLSGDAREYISKYDVKAQIKKAEKLITKLVDEE